MKQLLFYMDLVFKPAQLNDVEIILDLMAQYYIIDGIEFNREKSKATLETFFTAEYGAIFIIHLSDQAIGYYCLAYSYTLEYHGKDCFLDEIFIKQEYRHQGIGTKVMRYIEDFLSTKGFKAMHLIIFHQNKNAYKYYLKNGFKKHEAYFMTKVLKENSKLNLIE